MSFVHLSVHSEYSLTDSLVRIETLYEQAKEKGMPAVAICDTGNMFGAVKSYSEGLEAGVKPIIGCELQVSSARIGLATLSVLCKDDTGYRALCEIISRGFLEGVRDGLDRPIIPLEWLEGNSSGLVALSGGREGEIGRLLLTQRDDAAAQALSQLKSIFGDDFYLELQRIGHIHDDRYIRAAVKLATETRTPVVATNPVRFMAPDQFTSHEIRLAIAQRRPVKVMREDLTQPATQHQYFKSPEEMRELFSDIPSAIENTVRIAAKCSIEINLGKNYLPTFPATGDLNESDFLRKMAKEGLEERLEFYFKDAAVIAEHRKQYEDRLDFELNTINEMGFPGYFLIVADFIRWAKRNDIPVGPGRGSGAGSLVAYSIGITDINPLPYHLLFERFLNPERVSMPDFDVDFCMDKRDRVIQYVADTYGHNAVSQIITFGTMAAKMVVRDVARALGYPFRMADGIAKLIPDRPGVTLKDALKEEPALKLMTETDGDVRIVMEHAIALEGITRQVGKHAGGVLIAPNRLTDFTPVYCDSEGNGLVSQYDKDDVEAAGLVKFDFLGLRTLTVIDGAIKPINRRRASQGLPEINILDIPLDDVDSYDLLKRCETTAVFQLESSGMKNLIKTLQPSCFEDIIALVALFRPGPLQSGMVDDFVNRKHGRADVTYPHELLKPVLENTYGVIVYQEQVMQIAQVLAGYTLGGADMLRRAMGKKKPEEMAKQRSIFMDGANNNGINAQLAGSIFDLMEKFAEYGFNKSHSAAYALIAYQTAYLKAHYPADFMASVLSSEMGDTDKVVRFIHECRSMNLTVMPPDINHSEWAFTTLQGKVVYGMGAIKSLGESAAESILEERKKGGHYTSLVDFLYRNKVSKTVVEACINAGMFDFTGMDRAELLATFPMALEAAKQQRKNVDQGSLFAFELPPPPRKKVDPMLMDIRLSGERKVLGLYLTGHPYAKFKPVLEKAMTNSLAGVLNNLEDESVDKRSKYQSVTVAGLISDMDIKANSRGNYAFFKLDDSTARLRCSVFGKTFHDYQAFTKDDHMVVIKGMIRINPKTDEISLMVDVVQPLQSFLENQPGRLIINVNDAETPAKIMGRLHGKLANAEEGNITIAVRAADGEVSDLPIPGIPLKSTQLQSVMEGYGERAALEYQSAELKRQSRKQSSDIVPVANVQDLEAMRASIRLELESNLNDAAAAMSKSVEMTP